MQARTTVNDVRIAFRVYVEALHGLGVDTTGLRLEVGSRTAGTDYRVMDRDYTGGPGTAWNGYIGSSAPEAYAALHNIARALKFANEFMVANPERVLH